MKKDPILSKEDFLNKIRMTDIIIEIEDDKDEKLEHLNIEYQESELFLGHDIIIEWYSGEEMDDAFVYG